MRNTFDIVDLVYKVLTANSSIVTGISGKVWKNIRPVVAGAETKEDIVIGSLPINGEQVQQAVMNVNIHVPNLRLSFNGVDDNSQPDTIRLKTLTALVINTLDNKFYNDYWFFVQQQNLFADTDAAANHYSNIRLEFYSENN